MDHHRLLHEVVEEATWEDLQYYMAYKKVQAREEKQRRSIERQRNQAQNRSFPRTSKGKR